MIRVCHIANLITGRADGVYTHIKMILRNYDKTKFEHCLVFQGGEKIERELKEMGIKVFISSSLDKKISLKAFSDIKKIIKDNNIDIIHAHLNKPYIIAGLLNIFLKKKFIYNYNGIFLKDNPYYNSIENIIYKGCHLLIYLLGKTDAALVPSERSKQLLMNETGLFPEPIVYYNGFDMDYMNKGNIQDEEIRKIILKAKAEGFIIAVVSRLDIQKRIDRALDLFKQLVAKKNNLFLLIFGDGNLKEELIKRSRLNGLDSRVIFFDFVNNLTVYYCYFDILLFTSDWEGMPLSMWEAMANKIPVVAPDVGGFKEILIANNCGKVYSPGNIGNAEEELIKLIENKQLRDELGRNGFEVIKEKYNSEKFISTIEDIYKNLIS